MPRTTHVEAKTLAADGRRLYSLGDVCRLTGAKRSQVENWVRKGCVAPDYPTTGTGNQRGFTFRNLIEFRILVLLHELGLSLEHMRGALRGVRLADPEDSPWEMPRFAASKEELARIRAQAPPEKREALDRSWAEHDAEQERELALVDAELAAAGSKTLSQSMADELAAWRTFKDPATRSRVTAEAVSLLCFYGDLRGGLLVYGTSHLLDVFGYYGAAVILDMNRVFGAMEAATDDHWNKTGDRS